MNKTQQERIVRHLLSSYADLQTQYRKLVQNLVSAKFDDDDYSGVQIEDLDNKHFQITIFSDPITARFSMVLEEERDYYCYGKLTFSARKDEDEKRRIGVLDLYLYQGRVYCNKQLNEPICDIDNPILGKHIVMELVTAYTKLDLFKP